MISDISLNILSNIIKKMNKLECLYLSDNKFTNSGLFSELIEQLPNNLRVLSLKSIIQLLIDCNCDENIVSALSQYIWSNNTMERLDISQSGFGIQSDEIFGIYYYI